MLLGKHPAAVIGRAMQETGEDDSWRSRQPLRAELRRVQVAPELVDVDSLLKKWEEAIAHLPQLMQLVGEVLLHLAELGTTRAEVLIREGEAASRVRLCSRGSSAKPCDR